MRGTNGRREEEREVSQHPFGEVIAAYTRQQAIADGVLIDVTAMAREAGFRYPMALTASVWGRYVEVPTYLPEQSGEGRTWDIVCMLRYGIAESDGGREHLFKLYVANEPGSPKPITLKAVCGPGDDGEPVITVMLPEED